MPQELTQKQLVELTKQLDQQRQRLMIQLDENQAQSAPVKLDQQAVGRVSRIDAIQQQQMAKANREQDRQLLAATIASLKRIDDNEYGHCLECAEPIGYARLQVQPQVALCLECQSRQENR